MVGDLADDSMRHGVLLSDVFADAGRAAVVFGISSAKIVPKKKSPKKRFFSLFFCSIPLLMPIFGATRRNAVPRGRKMLAYPWGASADADAAEREEKQSETFRETPAFLQARNVVFDMPLGS